MARAVDFSFTKLTPAQVVAIPAVGVIGYLSSSPQKRLADARPYLEAGLQVGLVFEDTATNALGGWSQGVSDAREALDQVRQLGAPDSTTIYFAVDFGASASQMPTVEAYFAGIATVLPRERVGAYGDYYVLSQLHSVNACARFWQTLAWSYGAIFAGACLYQDGSTYYNGAADGDQIRSAWGAWSPSPSPPPTPASWPLSSYDLTGEEF